MGASPQRVIASFRHQPLTTTLALVPETTLIRAVSVDGHPGALSQFATYGETHGHGLVYNVTIGSYMMLKACPCQVVEVTLTRGTRANCGRRMHVRGRDLFGGGLHEAV